MLQCAEVYAARALGRQAGRGKGRRQSAQRDDAFIILFLYHGVLVARVDVRLGPGVVDHGEDLVRAVINIVDVLLVLLEVRPGRRDDGTDLLRGLGFLLARHDHLLLGQSDRRRLLVQRELVGGLRSGCAVHDLGSDSCGEWQAIASIGGWQQMGEATRHMARRHCTRGQYAYAYTLRPHALLIDM